MSENTLIYLLALIPQLIAIIILFVRDKVEKEPPALIIILMVAGYFASIIAAYMNSFLGELFKKVVPQTSYLRILAYYFFVVALNEEGIKFFMLKHLTWNQRAFNYKYDGYLYGAVVGAGFTIGECIIYGLNHGLATTITRDLNMFTYHMFMGMMMGKFYSSAKYRYNCGNRKMGLAYLLLAYMVPAVYHGVYDAWCWTEQGTAGYYIFQIIFIVMFLVFVPFGTKDRPIGGDSAETHRGRAVGKILAGAVFLMIMIFIIPLYSYIPVKILQNTCVWERTYAYDLGDDLPYGTCVLKQLNTGSGSLAFGSIVDLSEPEEYYEDINYGTAAVVLALPGDSVRIQAGKVLRNGIDVTDEIVLTETVSETLQDKTWLEKDADSLAQLISAEHFELGDKEYLFIFPAGDGSYQYIKTDAENIILLTEAGQESLIPGHGYIYLSTDESKTVSSLTYGEVAAVRTGTTESASYVIIGVPGDHIEITDNVICRNGEALSDEYCCNESLSDKKLVETDVTLGDGEYFIIHRDPWTYTLGSQRFGPVKGEDLTGIIYKGRNQFETFLIRNFPYLVIVAYLIIVSMGSAISDRRKSA